MYNFLTTQKQSSFKASEALANTSKITLCLQGRFFFFLTSLENSDVHGFFSELVSVFFLVLVLTLFLSWLFDSAYCSMPVPSVSLDSIFNLDSSLVTQLNLVSQHPF